MSIGTWLDRITTGHHNYVIDDKLHGCVPPGRNAAVTAADKNTATIALRELNQHLEGETPTPEDCIALTKLKLRYQKFGNSPAIQSLVARIDSVTTRIIRINVGASEIRHCRIYDLAAKSALFTELATQPHLCDNEIDFSSYGFSRKPLKLGMNFLQGDSINLTQCHIAELIELMRFGDHVGSDEILKLVRNEIRRRFESSPTDLLKLLPMVQVALLSGRWSVLPDLIDRDQEVPVQPGTGELAKRLRNCFSLKEYCPSHTADERIDFAISHGIQDIDLFGCRELTLSSFTKLIDSSLNPIALHLSCETIDDGIGEALAGATTLTSLEIWSHTFNQELTLPARLQRFEMRDCRAFNQNLTLPTGLQHFRIWGCSTFNQELTLPAGLQRFVMWNSDSFNQELTLPTGLQHFRIWGCSTFNQELTLPAGLQRFMMNCNAFNQRLTLPPGLQHFVMSGCRKFNQKLTLHPGLQSFVMRGCFAFNQKLPLHPGLQHFEMWDSHSFNQELTLHPGLKTFKACHCLAFDQELTLPDGVQLIEMW